jgi:rod shape-determining protein MreB
MSIFNFFSNDVAIDLGTANTLIWLKGKGVVLNEPSIVAYDSTNRNLIAIGHEAKAMEGKTPKHIIIERPIRDGAIANFEITEAMIRAFIRKVANTFQPARRIVVCIPSGLTEVEKRAVRDSCEHAGAKEVHLIHEPMAAAIGIGLNVFEPVGNMIVDIGGGTTEIAVIASSAIIEFKSVRIAGDEMTAAIKSFFRRNYNFDVGTQNAEDLKCQVGSAVSLEEEFDIEVKGLDLIKGLPSKLQVSSVEIREALADAINQIVEAVLKVCENTPPQLSADIFDRGIMLSGGGALLKGLDEKIRQATQLPVHVADDPLTAVARGTGRVLENLDEYSSVLVKNTRF